MFKLQLGTQKHDMDMQSQHDQNHYETRKFTVTTRIYHHRHQMPDKRNFLHERVDMIEVFRSSWQVSLKWQSSGLLHCVAAIRTKQGHSKPAGSIFFPIVRTNVLSYN